MRKPASFVVAAALILAGIAGWAASSNHARVEAATQASVDPMQIMTLATALPAESWFDFSVALD